MSGLLISFSFNIKLVWDNNFSSTQKSVRTNNKGKKSANDGTASREQNKAIVYRLKDGDVSKINPVSASKGTIFPENIIIPPGTYFFLGNNYSLREEGLYRFVLPGEMNIQRIVYQNDLDGLLSSICWIVTHGNKDDKKSLLELSSKALQSKLFITCGTVSKWAQSLLRSIDIDSRVVGGITVEEWNDYDNGHLLLEIWRQKWNKWVVYDFDNNSFFLPLDSDRPLSVIEWSKLIREDKYRIQPLASDTRLDVSGFISVDGYDYGFFSEGINADILSWYARVMQVPFIYDENQRMFIFMDAEQKTRVESYSTSYRYMDKKIFMERYYKEEL